VWIQKARAPALLKKLNGVLEGKEYLEQNTFSVADVAVYVCGVAQILRI